MNSLHLQPTSYSQCYIRPWLASKRPKHVTTPNSTSVALTDQQTPYGQLVDFIEREGGYVHPALQLSTSTGGIVAAQNVPRLKGSLVELPLSLRMTPEVAQELLLPALNAAGLPTMSLLDESQQLALAVAWLKQQGRYCVPDSNSAAAKWQPYVNSMSPDIPCGWAKTFEQLSADYDAFLHQHGLDLAWWRYFLAQVKQQMHDQAEQLSARYSRALGVTCDDILWALGQVTARKVVIDDQVLLELWSDMLRHPSSGSSSSSNTSSRCEIVWSYGLDRSGTSVVSRGAARRVITHVSSSSSGGGGGSRSGDDHGNCDRSVAAGPQQQTAAAAEAADQQQQQQELLLASGEELWASSSSSGGSSSNVNELFSLFISEHGHLAPLAWYLQHGVVPQGLADVHMRTSDILDSWRMTVEAESSGTAGSSSSSSSGTAASGTGNSSSTPPTVLWDYLTQQYQQDVLTVLAATPKDHQQKLLQWVLKPVTASAARPEAESGAVENISQRSRLDAEPLPMIGVLDELLLAAIDAADNGAL